MFESYQQGPEKLIENCASQQSGSLRVSLTEEREAGPFRAELTELGFRSLEMEKKQAISGARGKKHMKVPRIPRYLMVPDLSF